MPLRVPLLIAFVAASGPCALGQSSRSADPRAEQSVTVYASRTDFEADCGAGLPTETFEEARVVPGDSATFTGPLQEAVDNDVFGRKDILFDMRVDADSAERSGDLFVAGAGVGGGPSVRVGNADHDHDLDLEFGPALGCLGFEVRLRRGHATTITAYDGTKTALGTTTVSGPAPTFVGFRSAVPRVIRRIRIGTAAAGERAEVDDVSFGDAGSGGRLVLTLMEKSPTTVAPGGSVRFGYTLTNQSDRVLRGGLFFYAERDGRPVARGRLVEGDLPGHGQKSQIYTQPVPKAAPPGDYDYFVCAGPTIESPVKCSLVLVVTVTP